MLPIWDRGFHADESRGTGAVLTDLGRLLECVAGHLRVLELTLHSVPAPLLGHGTACGPAPPPRTGPSAPRSSRPRLQAASRFSAWFCATVPRWPALLAVHQTGPETGRRRPASPAGCRRRSRAAVPVTSRCSRDDCSTFGYASSVRRRRGDARRGPRRRSRRWAPRAAWQCRTGACRATCRRRHMAPCCTVPCNVGPPCPAAPRR
jgi:hypothetical protein